MRMWIRFSNHRAVRLEQGFAGLGLGLPSLLAHGGTASARSPVLVVGNRNATPKAMTISSVARDHQKTLRLHASDLRWPGRSVHSSISHENSWQMAIESLTSTWIGDNAMTR